MSESSLDPPWDDYDPYKLDESILAWPPTSQAPPFEEQISKFARNNNNSSKLSINEPRDPPIEPGRRSSYASFESLERCMRNRIPKEGQSLKTYSTMALQKILFVKRNLSVSSLGSCGSKSTTTTFRSHPGSLAIRDSIYTSTLAPMSPNRDLTMTRISAPEPPVQDEVYHARPGTSSSLGRLSLTATFICHCTSTFWVWSLFHVRKLSRHQ